MARSDSTPRPILTRSRKHDSRDGWYSITPPQAAALLNGMGKNRPLKEHQAQRIADDIMNGLWRPNGETIIFDEKGRPIDCQHRLRACVLANKPIETYCVFGIPARFFPSFDQGKARGGSDLAALMNFSNANLIAATSRLAIMYEDGTLGQTGTRAMPSERLKQYYERHRDRLTEAVAMAMKFRAGIVKLIPMSHASFAYYVTNDLHPEQATIFIERLATGVDLKKGDAIIAFRQRMLDLVGVKHRLRQTEKLALLIKAWNAFLEGKPITILRWKTDTEVFPRFN